MVNVLPNQKHPLFIYILTFAEFWDRFSYYGIQALLVLYLTKVFIFSDHAAYGLYGVFTALTFASTILGGIIADKLIGAQHGIIIGAFLIVLGNLLLILPAPNFLYFGLATLIGGIGFFKPNSANFAGTLYEGEATAKREGGFSIFYMGMNAGALLGPLTYGAVSKIFGWHAGFYISAIGTCVSLILLILHRTLFSNKHSSSPNLFFDKKILLVSVVTLISIWVFALLIEHHSAFGSLLGFIGLTTIIGLVVIAVKSPLIERKHIVALSILSFFCIFYFSCSLQTATTLTLFIERNIDRNIFGLQIPTMIFLSLQPFFIILCAPFMGKFWAVLSQRNILNSIAPKISLGLFFAAMSFFIFSWAAYYSTQNYLRLVGIIVGNFTLALGELCTLPILLSAISQFSPKKWRSTMIGVLFLSLAFSGYFAGIIAQLASTHTTIKNMSTNVAINYSLTFIDIGGAAFLISLIILLLTPLLKKLFQQHSI